MSTQLFDPARLLTETLRALPQRAALTASLAAGLDAVEPGRAVRAALQRPATALTVAGRSYDLGQVRKVLLVGAGKAGAPMAAAAADLLRDKLGGGVVIVKDGHARPSAGPLVILREAGHPLPDGRGAHAAAQILALLRTARPNDLVLALLSGGGSALLSAPPPGITLADKRTLTTALLRSGADIAAINTVRKHLSLLKGGQMAQAAAPAALIALILSDVVGSPLDVIASGPTVPDPTSYAEALAVLVRYGLLAETPRSIREYLERGAGGSVPETPKPGDPLFSQVQNVVVGSNATALAAITAAAQAHGLPAAIVTETLTGEASAAGRELATLARAVASGQHQLRPPILLLAGGETTVTVRGDGLGGRNQELALAAVEPLAGLRSVTLVALATDGGDGPTDAAGAVVSGQTLERARTRGLEPAAFLARNDAYHFFQPLNDLLLPGPTLTNVNDVTAILVE